MMRLSENKQNQQAGQPGTEAGTEKKKFSFSAGTVLFLSFNFLLVLGLCKFSFYVLKNHRSAVSRDTLVKTYVDVQPYAGKQKDAYYITLKNQDNPAPAPFFASRPAAEAGLPETTKNPETPGVPSPMLLRTKTPVMPSAPAAQAKAPRRPPVIRPPVIKEEVQARQEISVQPAQGVSIDELMTAGLDLLNESDKTAIASELLLEEEAPAAAKAAQTNVSASPVPAVKAAAVKNNPPVKTAAVKKPVPDTHWVDIAALRRRIEEENASSVQKAKEETVRANAALLEMNARQMAAVNTGTATDSEIPVKEEKTPADPSITTAVVQDIPFAGTEKPEESAKKPETPVQTAVVQDTPFAGTQEQSPSAENKPQKPLFLTSKEQIAAMAGDSPSLWKVAKARGVPRNTLAVKHGEFNRDADAVSAEQAASLAETDAPKPLLSKTPAADEESGPTVIYRNGRTKHVFGDEKGTVQAAADPAPAGKPLDWFDRQEAAVWTSMSQSDAPSVWSAASDPDDGNPDRARAFRVADEQPAAPAAATPASTQPAASAAAAPAAESTPAVVPSTAEANRNDNVVTSSQVRVVGEEQKPEAKENPILMPLGSQTATPGMPPAASSQLPPVNPAIQAPAVNPGGLAGLSNIPQPPAAAQAAAEGAAAGEDPGLMDKLFSFFGKTETPAVPNIGSGTPVPEESDKKTDSKNDSKGKKADTGKQTQAAASTAQQTESRPDRTIVPTELRLTFKPDSTEISAQSVKWIKAFGQRAKKDIQSAVEVRMSNTNPALQEKRFALIRSTLVGAGMSDVQILPVMTDRTPHTIVLRTLELPEEGISEYTTSEGGIKERVYYKQW